jgi:hypothetical protein
MFPMNRTIAARICGIGNAASCGRRVWRYSLALVPHSFGVETMHGAFTLWNRKRAKSTRPPPEPAPSLSATPPSTKHHSCTGTSTNMKTASSKASSTPDRTCTWCWDPAIRHGDPCRVSPPLADNAGHDDQCAGAGWPESGR